MKSNTVNKTTFNMNFSTTTTYIQYIMQSNLLLTIPHIQDGEINMKCK